LRHKIKLKGKLERDYEACGDDFKIQGLSLFELLNAIQGRAATITIEFNMKPAQIRQILGETHPTLPLLSGENKARPRAKKRPGKPGNDSAV